MSHPVKPPSSLRQRIGGGRGYSFQSSLDGQPRALGLFVPALLIAGKTDKMKVFEATISALACGLDVIPCGQVVDALKLSAFAILVMPSGKYHSRSANTALPALNLKCASLASVFVLREFAQMIAVLLQCLVAVAKVQSEPLSTRLKGGGPSPVGRVGATVTAMSRR
ncbi:hypothetical protein [Rhizobium giardinii]|uniref:hypothetical protein n=1 Tax=Rhizobium giardinii TaxID=56731 RepID=UPI003D6F5ABE